MPSSPSQDIVLSSQGLTENNFKAYDSNVALECAHWGAQGHPSLFRKSGGLCTCLCHFFLSPAGGSLRRDKALPSPSPSDKQTRLKTGSTVAEHCAFSTRHRRRTSWVVLWVDVRIETTQQEAKIIPCSCVFMWYSEPPVFVFFIFSRNSSDLISLCPDFGDVALGRTAHGLQTLLDVGSLCHFQ